MSSDFKRRSAIYFPHTRINTEKLLKTSLLLWDRLEFIVPDPGYKLAYEDKQFQRAIELFGGARYPSDDEKKKTHEDVMEILTRPTLPKLYSPFGLGYHIYQEKFSEATWDMLQDLGLAVRSSGQPGDPTTVPEPTGLLMMSMLADACAGETYARVTDHPLAYGNLANLLVGPDPDNVFGRMQTVAARYIPISIYDIVVPLTLDVIDTSDIPLEDLINFREREEKENGGSSLTVLRHNYGTTVEKWVTSIKEHAKSLADLEEIKRQFQQTMRNDFKELGRELGLARREFSFSPSVFTVIVGVGALLGAAAGLVLPLPGPIATAAGAVITIGGILSQHGKYAAARKALLEKHPMGLMYELQRFA